MNFGGRKLKLGPAIMKERSARTMPPRPVGPDPWMNPPQYVYCTCCSPMGGGMPQPSPILNGGSPYSQPYSYPNYGGVVYPQMPMNYAQNPYTYQNFVDNGVQTMMTVL
ncbi:deleted in azoospermia-like isoform X2 [Notothenia coriiceps]|uniref:Deleted in azoospermia-like isoform X2 n=1 Tax=Notothenia coriiceps TaxID=8208 RepID=A0A6I9Q0V9_9TELE|nr:PREDICTED: deleted in azoospermia-like isoform X2 [Notothenia coriiceps]